MRPEPRSSRILTQWVDQYARQEGEAPGRVRSWVSFMILAGALQRAGFVGDGPTFTVKGGVALELRLRTAARATRDLDVILAAPTEPVAALGEALQEPYQRFSFRIQQQAHEMPSGTVRVRVSLDYRGRHWGTVQVDVSPPELEGAQFDFVDAIDLSGFGLGGPPHVPCLALPYHVAHKLHAATRPDAPGWRNDRFRDLVDLLLIRDWIDDVSVLLPACREIFGIRATHSWPPDMQVRDSWIEPFARMASELELRQNDLHQAVIELRHFIHEIDSAAPLWPRIDMPDGLTASTWYYAAQADDSVVRIPFRIGDGLIREPSAVVADVKEEWQRNRGGVTLIGVVVFLLDRRPVFFERLGVFRVAVSGEAEEVKVAYAPAVWDDLARSLVARARAPKRALTALASYLSTHHGILPAQLGSVSGESTQWMHQLWPELGRDGSPKLAWDVAASTPVDLQPPRRRRTISQR